MIIHGSICLNNFYLMNEKTIEAEWFKMVSIVKQSNSLKLMEGEFYFHAIRNYHTKDSESCGYKAIFAMNSNFDSWSNNLFIYVEFRTKQNRLPSSNTLLKSHIYWKTNMIFRNKNINKWYLWEDKSSPQVSPVR